MLTAVPAPRVLETGIAGSGGSGRSWIGLEVGETGDTSGPSSLLVVETGETAVALGFWTEVSIVRFLVAVAAGPPLSFPGGGCGLFGPTARRSVADVVVWDMSPWWAAMFS